MIHYNHDKLVNHIAEAYLAGAELDQPLMPHKNNGEPSYALCDRKTSTEVAFLFI